MNLLAGREQKVSPKIDATNDAMQMLLKKLAAQQAPNPPQVQPITDYPVQQILKLEPPVVTPAQPKDTSLVNCLTNLMNNTNKSDCQKNDLSPCPKDEILNIESNASVENLPIE